MLFHEIYGKYYQAVAEILKEAACHTLTDAKLRTIVEETAFAESNMTIPDALGSGRWPLLGNRNVIHYPPTMPLTTLQKRWLKALLLDKRIALFQPDIRGLEDVPPLYTPDMLVYFDRYTDADPYDDPVYIRNFRTILAAIRNHQGLKIHAVNRRGKLQEWVCSPCRLEYSEKDDKFRLLAVHARNPVTLNLSRIADCVPLEPQWEHSGTLPPSSVKQLVLELTDYRNALERAMLHFSHLEKQTERLDEKHYRITLWYQNEDETELLIRVLSFGPMLRVVSPEDFALLVKKRVKLQMKLRAQQ